MNTHDVRTIVKEKYGQAAVRAKTGAANACCGGTAAKPPFCWPRVVVSE